ncbi:MarR family transcriptional regulator [Streptomyces sp. NPDC002838]|uniref:MarR family transcriptional regulator n=1 Tax=Streptomyces sp. NPDC002838 TaxID=3154436 RepID=UPI00332C31FD
MITTALTVDGRVIALAHYAGRAVLESVLARYGMAFQEMVTLRLVAVADAPVEREDLVGQVVDALKVDGADVHGVVEELLAKGLVATEATRLRVTGAGRELYDLASAETGEISARIYTGIPVEDLATTGRVLTLVTGRANTELAALTK